MPEYNYYNTLENQIPTWTLIKLCYKKFYKSYGRKMNKEGR